MKKKTPKCANCDEQPVEMPDGHCLDCHNAKATAKRPVATLITHLFRGVIGGLYQAGMEIDIGDILNGTLAFFSETIINQEHPENWKELAIRSLDTLEMYLAKKEKDEHTEAGEPVN